MRRAGRWLWLSFYRAVSRVLGVSASQSTLVMSAFTQTADGSSTLTGTYTARDASGAVLAGVPVTFAVTRGLLSASASLVDTSIGSIANDGVEAATITVTAVDTAAHAVVGIPAANVVEAATGSGNTLTDVGTATNYAGAITSTFKSTGAATKTISATVMGLAVTDTATVIVSGSAAWRANEPVGYTTQIDDPVADRTSLSAWDTTYQVLVDTRCVNITDASAPVSPSGGIAAYFPIGFLDSDQPMALQEDFADAKEVYFAVAMRIPSPWDYHDSGFNKMGFIDTNSNANVNITNEIVWSLRGTTEVGSRMEVHIQEPTTRFLTQNIAATDFTLGVWHKMEYQIIQSTGGAANGTVRWWQDGVLVGEYTDVEMKAGANAVFKNFQFSPNWGGSSSDSKTSADYIQIDHIYVSTLAV